MTRRQETAFLQFAYVYPFVHDNGINVVELHWEIRPKHFSFLFDPECMWEHLEPISLAGKEVLTLSPEDLLLILCAHGTDHLWERLQRICDVAELVRVSKGMDWRRVMEQAGELGSQRMLFLGLLLASDLLGTVLPEEIRQRMQADLSARALAKRVRERLFREAGGPSGIFESTLFHLRARERLRDKVRYCTRLAITPTIGDWTLLPTFLPSFFYYILRPIRLVKKYGPSLLRRSL